MINDGVPFTYSDYYNENNSNNEKKMAMRGRSKSQNDVSNKITIISQDINTPPLIENGRNERNDKKNNKELKKSNKYKLPLNNDYNKKIKQEYFCGDVDNNNNDNVNNDDITNFKEQWDKVFEEFKNLQTEILTEENCNPQENLTPIEQFEAHAIISVLLSKKKINANKFENLKVEAVSQEPENLIYNISLQEKEQDELPLATLETNRFDALTILQKQLYTERKYLKDKLDTVKNNADLFFQFVLRIENLEKQIIYCENFIKENKIKWMKTTSIRKGFDRYKEKIKEIYPSALVNLRSQVLGDYIAHRSGVISDFTHGRVSIKDIKNYLDKDPKAKKKIVKDYFSKNASHLNKISANNIFEERKQKLTSQFLQDLYTHFEEKPITQSINGKVVYARMSLLNPHKKPEKNKNGFVNNERVQLEDMQFIMNEMKNKTIIFDVKDSEDPLLDGPFIDENGHIHMPARFYKEEHNDETIPNLKLDTVLFNISVQGDTKNTKPQKTINAQALQDLKKIIEDIEMSESDKIEINKIFDNINNGLYQGNASPKSIIKYWEVVENILLLYSKLFLITKGAFKFSINCYGGKDRTGYAMALLASSLFRNDILAQSSLSEKEKEKIMVEWDLFLMSDRAPLVAVVEDNTGQKGVKLSDIFGLDLFHMWDSSKGLKMRLRSIINGLMANFN